MPPTPPPPKRSAAPPAPPWWSAPCHFALGARLPGVAHRLGGRVDTHVTASRWKRSARSHPLVLPPAHGSRADAHAAALVILLDPGCSPAWSGAAGTAAVEPVPVAASATRTTVTGVRAPQADEQTIRPDAELLFVAGAGWTKKQADGPRTRPRPSS